MIDHVNHISIWKHSEEWKYREVQRGKYKAEKHNEAAGKERRYRPGLVQSKGGTADNRGLNIRLKNSNFACKDELRDTILLSVWSNLFVFDHLII